MSSYQRRQRQDVLASLERAGVIAESYDTDAYELLQLADTTKDRITIPAQFDYSSLSLVALKTALACHAAARYSRTPFRFIATQRELAKQAGVSEFRLRTALAELQQKHYLHAVKLWRQGTQVTLHEPGSDVPLYYLGEYQQQRVDTLPVYDRYRYLLAKFDPKQKLEQTTGPVHGYRTHCPFCKCSTDPTFAFTSEEDDDHWQCHNCHRSGDSYRLWAMLSNWREDNDWRQIVASGSPPPMVTEGCGLEGMTA
ncbi:hypothetical protein [Terriglobus roseus]|nr:hypothetical protein [Terriglobus roseus]